MPKVRFFRLLEPEMPWGDYGRLLLHGMAHHLGRKGGRVQLERTGPFVPPVSLPGITWMCGPLVRDDVKRALRRAECRGFACRQVIRARIVRLEWHRWDLSAPEPRHSPSGCPEDYILRRRHQPAVAAAIGALWELRLRNVAPSRRGASRLMGWRGEDVFLVAEERCTYWISERARGALEGFDGRWLNLEPVQALV